MERQRAWELVREIVRDQPGTTRPVFERWHGEEDVFSVKASDSNSLGIRGFSKHRATASAAQSEFESADAPLLTYTLYNESSYQHIKMNKLNRLTELVQLRQEGVADTRVPRNRSTPSFPNDALVLKTVWWPVAHDGVTALPVWDPELNPSRKGGNNYTTWKRVVAVEPFAGSQVGDPLRVAFAGSAFNARRVSLNTFYSVVVDSAMASNAMRDPTARKAAFISIGREIEAGDYLILVGANLASRQTENWIWVTLWWHDVPDRGPFAANRPRDLGGKWRNYLMTAAFDSEEPRGADGGPHICFNPWLEGRFPDAGKGGGTVSNCMACHQRASFPAVKFLPVTRGASDLDRDPAFAPARLRTSFLWSIALHAGP